MGKYAQLSKYLKDLAENDKDKFREILSQLTEAEAEEIIYDSWRDVWARPNQLIEDWWPEQIALVMAGRGFGKTRLAVECIKEQERKGVKLFTFCAPTASDLRDTIVEGPSGLLSVYAPNDPRKPEYISSKSRVEWPSGAVARLISAENPERARGVNSEFLYMDEVGSIDDKDIFDQLMFGLRIGTAKALITTTPRANKIMIALNKRIGKDVRLISGSTYENAANLSAGFITTIRDAYEGTSLGSQELEGKLILSSEDALWQQQTILDNTVDEEDLPASFVSVAIGVDPAVSKGKHSDLTGICVVAVGDNGKMYVLGDFSGKYSPKAWAQKVVSLYDTYAAFAPTTIIVERNQGGDLVKDSLSRERNFLPVKDVFATANKLARAQPIALLYEQGKVKHVRGRKLQPLEDEMISFDGKGKQKSPDRLDSMVMACTHLMPSQPARIITKEFFL